MVYQQNPCTQTDRTRLALHELRQIQYRTERSPIAKRPGDVCRSLWDLPQLDARDHFHDMAGVERITVMADGKQDVHHRLLESPVNRPLPLCKLWDSSDNCAMARVEACKDPIVRCAASCNWIIAA